MEREKQRSADTIVLGLGNSIVSDDAVGLLVARKVATMIRPDDGVAVEENERGGMDVLDLIAPYRKAVLVDAIKTGQCRPGSLCLLSADELPPTRRLCGLHDLDLPTAMELARRLNLSLPEEITVLAVEIEDDLTFGEECTARVAEAIEPAARATLALAMGEPMPQGVDVYGIGEPGESKEVEDV